MDYKEAWEKLKGIIKRQSKSKDFDEETKFVLETTLELINGVEKMYKQYEKTEGVNNGK